MELCQETKNINRTTILYSSSMSCHILKEKKTLIQKDICTLMFMAALFTTAKIGKHPKCLCTDDKENATHTHTHEHQP